MAIGTNIKKRMGEMTPPMRPKDLLVRCKELEPRSGISQQQINAMIKRDTKRSQYVPLVARALELTAEQLMSGRWGVKTAKPSAAQEPRSSYGFLPETRMWAEQFQALSPDIRRKWWVMVLLLGDALPDKDVEKFIPSLRADADRQR
ncbi:MAG TPA: hypothetical protein VJT81_06735 [Burkholderiales bacterium]|nr:hypothetical protein [Burkholderiales bacterium]